MKIISSSILLLFILTSALFDGCHNDESPAECIISECNEWAYSIVNKDTCNLIGVNGEPVHPDSIQITYQTGEIIPFRTRYQEFNDWWTFTFLYQDGLRRCDLYNTDSTFNMRFFIYLGNSDMDTLDIRIAPCRDFEQMSYNESAENWINPAIQNTFICNRNPNSIGSFLLRK